MGELPRDRAIAAADAVLRLPSPRGADEAGYVLCEVSRLAAELRSANHEAASADIGVPLLWLRPSAELASRLESTVTRWMTSLHPPSVWDQAAADALDCELGEVDRLAVEAASVAEFCARAEQQRQASPPWPADLPEPAPNPRRYAAAWAPALVLTVALGFAVFGVFAEPPAHTVTTAAEPARTSIPARSATSTSGHDPITPQRAATAAATPVPAKTRSITAIPTEHINVTLGAAPRRAKEIRLAHGHRSHRPGVPAESKLVADPTTSEIAQFNSSIIVAITQETNQQLLAALQQVQQEENSVLSSLQNQGR